MNDLVGTKPPFSGEHAVEVHRTIRSIDPLEWDRCNGTGHRLLSHAYLSVIEDSGVLEKMGGVHGRHIMLRDRSGNAVAAAPAYLKMHSLGELGADFGLPISHDRICGPYYPKLQVEVPLLPVIGPRLLVADGQDRRRLQIALIGALAGLVEAGDASSLQITFMSPDEMEAARAAGLHIGAEIQFIWRNKGYGNFGDFLAGLSKNRRNMVLRERRQALEDSLNIEWISGTKMTPVLSRKIAALLDNTYLKYSTQNWFTESYFEKLYSYMGDDVQVALVSNNAGEPVGATLFLINSSELVALQWGSSETRRFLMLETTLYQGIEWAIRESCTSVNFGSLGSHKSNRGALPTEAYHAFWFRNQAFNPIAAANIAKRLENLAATKREEMQRSPFQADRGGAGAIL